MSIEHIPLYKPAKKSIGEQISAYVVFFILVYGIWFVIASFFKMLFYPFYALITSDKEKFLEKVKENKLKVAKRIQYRKDFMVNPENPFFQYVERFKVRPDEYKNSSSNQYYQDWYASFQNGTLLDPKLSWAPEVYEELKCGDLRISQAFLDYLSNQVQLHMKVSFPKQLAFLKTIREMYPEFTPKFSVIISEIKNNQEQAKSQALQYELIEAIMAKGITRGLAKEFLNLSQDANEIKRYIFIAKAALERGFTEETCLFCIKKDFSPNDPFAEDMDGIIRLNVGFVADSYFRGDINQKEAENIINSGIENSRIAIRGLREPEAFAVMAAEIEKTFKTFMHTRCQKNLAGR